MAAKDPKRKGKRRAPRVTPLDDELLELAGVLSEYQLDNNAYGWFRPPWRNGECAIGLAAAAAYQTGIFDGNIETVYDETIIKALIDEAPRDSMTYERAGELHRRLIQPKINTTTARLLAAALRCVQLKISNSHGGGMVYNEILIPAFLPIKEQLVEGLVLDFRCLDALGTTRQLTNTNADRQRSAFTIAWKRGLYLAAYALKPVEARHGDQQINYHHHQTKTGSR